MSLSYHQYVGVDDSEDGSEDDSDGGGDDGDGGRSEGADCSVCMDSKGIFSILKIEFNITK